MSPVTQTVVPGAIGRTPAKVWNRDFRGSSLRHAPTTECHSYRPRTSIRTASSVAAIQKVRIRRRVHSTAPCKNRSTTVPLLALFLPAHTRHQVLGCIDVGLEVFSKHFWQTGLGQRVPSKRSQVFSEEAFSRQIGRSLNPLHQRCRVSNHVEGLHRETV
jgi:hypothetical protein